MGWRAHSIIRQCDLQAAFISVFCNNISLMRFRCVTLFEEGFHLTGTRNLLSLQGQDKIPSLALFGKARDKKKKKLHFFVCTQQYLNIFKDLALVTCL